MPGDEINIDNPPSVDNRPFSQFRRSSQGSEDLNNHLGSSQGETNEFRVFSAENSQNTQDRGSQKYMVPLYPLTLSASQMLILRYLTPMGEYQEFLPYVFEHNAMDIIFSYIDKVDNKNTCLAFEALKYLASLLCHKKFCIEFITRSGLQVKLFPLFLTCKTNIKNISS